VSDDIRCGMVIDPRHVERRGPALNPAATTPGGPTRPPPTLKDLLSQEDCKLALSTSEALAARERTSRLALFSACAYVILATLGYAREQRLLEREVPAARQAAEVAEKDAQSAADQEGSAFGSVREAHVELAMREGEASLLAGAAERDQQRLAAELARERAEAKRREQERRPAQARADQMLKQRTLELVAAKSKLAQAQAKSEEFRRKDIEDRFELDVRRSPVPAELRQAEAAASEEVEQAAQALERARAAAEAPVASPPGGDASPPGTVNRAEALRQPAEDAQQALARARTALARAEAEWQAAQRRATEASSRAAGARKKHDELADREQRQQMQLPVLSISLTPEYFFGAAPLVLLPLFLEGALTRHAQRKVLSWLRARAAASGVGDEWSTLFPALRDGLVSHAVPLLRALVTIATLGVLYFGGLARAFSAGALAAVGVAAVGIELRGRRRTADLATALPKTRSDPSVAGEAE
jgi:hypothetical protein